MIPVGPPSGAVCPFCRNLSYATVSCFVFQTFLQLYAADNLPPLVESVQSRPVFRWHAYSNVMVRTTNFFFCEKVLMAVLK